MTHLIYPAIATGNGEGRNFELVIGYAFKRVLEKYRSITIQALS
jgi:hypothetical protein